MGSYDIIVQPFMDKVGSNDVMNFRIYPRDEITTLPEDYSHLYLEENIPQLVAKAIEGDKTDWAVDSFKVWFGEMDELTFTEKYGEREEDTDAEETSTEELDVSEVSESEEPQAEAERGRNRN